MSRTKRGAPKRFQNHEEGWAKSYLEGFIGRLQSV